MICNYIKDKFKWIYKFGMIVEGVSLVVLLLFFFKRKWLKYI